MTIIRRKEQKLKKVYHRQYTKEQVQARAEAMSCFEVNNNRR